MLNPDRLNEILDGIKSVRVGVIGDFFLDKYLDTDPDLAETSVETGLVAHQVISETASAGAAGTVVNNLAALEVKSIRAFGAIGDDGNGFELIRCLESQGCDRAGLLQSHEWMTPTYLKPRDRTHQGLEGEHSRYDTKNRKALPLAMENVILDALERSVPELDAVIIVDQIEDLEGAIISRSIREKLCTLAVEHPQCQFLADSRFHIAEFKNVIVKPNQYEALGINFPSPETRIDAHLLETAIDELLDRPNRAVLCTMGAKGVTLRNEIEPVFVPAVRLSGPTDPTGAGDSFSAGFSASLATNASLLEATIVGVLAASVTTQMLAQTGTATRDAVFKEWERWQGQHFADPK